MTRCSRSLPLPAVARRMCVTTSVCACRNRQVVEQKSIEAQSIAAGVAHKGTPYKPFVARITGYTTSTVNPRRIIKPRAARACVRPHLETRTPRLLYERQHESPPPSSLQGPCPSVLLLISCRSVTADGDRRVLNSFIFSLTCIR